MRNYLALDPYAYIHQMHNASYLDALDAYLDALDAYLDALDAYLALVPT